MKRIVFIMILTLLIGGLIALVQGRFPSIFVDGLLLSAANIIVMVTMALFIVYLYERFMSKRHQRKK